MDPTVTELTARLERLERSNRRLKAVLVGLGLVGVGCGATTTVANYGTVRAHTVEVFTPAEDGHLLLLGRDAKGGRLELVRTDGKPGLVIDVDGVHPR